MNESDTSAGGDFIAGMDQTLHAVTDELQAEGCTLDVYFLAYLRHMARFGYFSYGPINIDVALIENIVAATTPRRAVRSSARPGMSEDFDYVGFSQKMVEEMRRTGRRRIDELHFLLAFMRTNAGLPGRVFGELGVSPEQVLEYARQGAATPQPLEKLYSPEEAADYLNVHVQTVRAWIRSGRLRARRLAGQRALRITASDLQSVLEPLTPEEE
jgi:excisionase family DNA binding protein